ncbi:hypothetical protein A3844_29470 [Paenibacillus helianthi]|uniref:TrkH family potassium uptake protein n=2 Tax=Paenibacillus helianthi TaxID=1349432 RepID=A0ABX3EHY0_9BACL|nr:hypothetical protein A3844_29470 [Paenibacillus helianthi]
MLVVAATMLLSVTESADFLTVLFEAVSAFGTSGITMGLTPELTTIGKLLVIVLMFVGRTGPLTLAYALKPKNTKSSTAIPKAISRLADTSRNRFIQLLIHNKNATL